MDGDFVFEDLTSDEKEAEAHQFLRRQYRQSSPVPLPIDDDADIGGNSPEPAKPVGCAQFVYEAYKPEDDGDDGNAELNKAASFFRSSENASFHADSFIELNLRHPLLRVVDGLGYRRLTPIRLWQSWVALKSLIFKYSGIFISITPHPDDDSETGIILLVAVSFEADWN